MAAGQTPYLVVAHPITDGFYGYSELVKTPLIIQGFKSDGTLRPFTDCESPRRMLLFDTQAEIHLPSAVERIANLIVVYDFHDNAFFLFKTLTCLKEFLVKSLSTLDVNYRYELQPVTFLSKDSLSNLRQLVRDSKRKVAVLGLEALSTFTDIVEYSKKKKERDDPSTEL